MRTISELRTQAVCLETHIGDRSNDGTQDAHDAVPPDSDSVARSSMRAGQHFWRVCIPAFRQ